MSHGRSWEKGKKRQGPLGEKAMSEGECQTLMGAGLVPYGQLARDGQGRAVSLEGPSILKHDTSPWLEYQG